MEDMGVLVDMLYVVMNVIIEWPVFFPALLCQPWYELEMRGTEDVGPYQGEGLVDIE